MEFFRKFIFLILLFSIGSMNARAIKGKSSSQQKISSPQIKHPRILSNRPAKRPAIAPQQPILKPQSYANALNIIRTQMPSNKVLINNAFTQEFINFVTSLNLADAQMQALLQAGVNLHAVLTDDDQTDQGILLSLKNNIQEIIQSKPAPSTQQSTQVKPITSSIAHKSIKQAQQIEQDIAIKKDFITHDAIIILDPSESEFQSGAMTTTAIAALYTKAAPIVMTSNILRNIIELRKKISSSDLQKLRTIDYQAKKDLALNICKSHNLTIKTIHDLILLSVIDFDNNNFNYYFHTSAPLVLVIPKQYMDTNFTNARHLDSNQQARACGFNSSIITTTINATHDALLKQLQQQLLTHMAEEKFVTHLTALFAPQKKDLELISPEKDIQWVMYLTGHGTSRKPIGAIREELKRYKKSLADWQRLKYNKHDTQANYWISFNQSAIKNNEKILQGKSSWPDSQLVSESAYVAGLSIENFLQLIKFFNTTLNMAFLNYSTCFAGGSNQSFVNEVFSSLNVNFIVSAEGVHEGTTSTAIYINEKTTTIQLENQRYDEFFRLLRIFITQPEELVKMKGKRKDPIPMIIRTIVLETNPGNQPFVRFPSTNTFVASPLDKNTKVLTQTFVKSHEIEKKAIDFSSQKTKMLIVNTPRINVQLNLGMTDSLFSIVFPSPKNNIPSYESMHMFKEINLNRSLPSFIHSLIEFNVRLYTQTVVINKLTGIWYGQSKLPETSNAIQHLIIQMKGITGTNSSAQSTPLMELKPLTSQDIKLGDIGANVHIAFELDGIIYQSVFGIKNFTDSYDIYLAVQKIIFTPTPAQTVNMNAIARNFLTPQEISQLTQPITLKSIADFINSKIDTQDPSMAMWSEANEEALSKVIAEHAQKQKQKSADKE